MISTVAFIWSLLIYCVDSLSFLCNVQFYNDNIVFLCCGLNVSFSTLSSPVVLFHVSFSGLVRVCINCNPSLSNQFYMIGSFSSPRSYAVTWSTFATSISKFNSFTHLSGAFKSNAGWLSIGPICLGLWGSSRLFLLVCGSVGGSAFLIALNATVAARVATCVMVARISSEFAIFLLRIQLLSNFCLPSWDFYSWHHVMLLAMY